MILDALLDAPGEDPAGHEMLRLCLFDWTACALAGRGDPAPLAARSLLADGGAPLIGGGTASPSTAACFNATAGHALDYDDTHFDHIGHVSTVILPAALSLARDWSGFAPAALAGAEAAIRVGVWLGRDHYSAGFHQTATSGAFGATLASARILGLDRATTRHALNLCAGMAAGLKVQFGTDGKPLNAGRAAATGVEAALLAKAGANAAPDAIDVFARTHAGQGGTSPDQPRFHAVSLKLHACCHGLHAALEALRPYLGRPIRTVRVATHPRWLSVCNQPAPTTGLGAKFSYRTALALALCGYDTADAGTFTDALATDPAVIAMRARIEVEGDDGLSDTAARVIIDGEVAEHDLAVPLPMDSLRPRVRAKADALIGARAEPLWSAIQSGDLARYRAATA